MKYIIVLVIGLVIGYFMGRRRGGVGNYKNGDNFSVTTEHLPSPEEKGTNFSAVQQEQKAENLQKVMEMVTLWQAQGLTGITNNDVEKELKVSNATAERYLNELEREGRLVQVGETGQGVYYKSK